MSFWTRKRATACAHHILMAGHTQCYALMA